MPNLWGALFAMLETLALRRPVVREPRMSDPEIWVGPSGLMRCGHGAPCDHRNAVVLAGGGVGRDSLAMRSMPVRGDQVA
jgi:hypothetical protein